MPDGVPILTGKAAGRLYLRGLGGFPRFMAFFTAPFQSRPIYRLSGFGSGDVLGVTFFWHRVRQIHISRTHTEAP